MRQSIRFDLDWLEGRHGPAEVVQTTGWLVIEVDGKYATRNEDRWAKSVRSGVLVSGYPLALWLASSWWRLRWEAAPVGSPGASWRMAHELSAAGYGYVWPSVVFVSDGESVDVRCHASEGDAWAPVSYITNFVGRVAAHDFEVASRELIELVLARLDAAGLHNSDLHVLWGELVSEFADAEANRLRSLEARVGFDPDESPKRLPAVLKRLTVDAGPSAADEVASACAGATVLPKLDRARKLATAPGPIGAIDIAGLAEASPRTGDDARAPWDRGHDMARRARAVLGLPAGPLSDAQLGDMLGVRVDDLSGSGVPMMQSELGLAVRSRRPAEFKFVFRKGKREARRFEAARFLGDSLVAPADDRWLPVADTKTARQKLQRAFAAELLMPIHELNGVMDNDFSTERMELAAERFEVSPLAVRSHLANHNHIPQF